MTSNDPNATAAESAIRQIGTEFRRLRTLRGERIEDIATYLDIKAIYLFGIEQGDLSVIPSKREAKAIVRYYADYLGLDGETIISPMDPIIASLEGEKAPPESQKSFQIDRTSAIILAASVVLGVLVGWSWIGDADQFDLITPPAADGSGSGNQDAAGGQSGDGAFDENSSAIKAADALLADLETALAESTEPQGGQAGEPTSSVEQVQAGKEVRPANVLAAVVAERGDGAHIYQADNTDARVIIRALADASVQVTSEGRDYVWTRNMKPREMLLVPNRDDLKLWIGDAAGIEILLDGVVLPPLGPPGTAISGLSLAVSSLEATSAALPAGGAEPTF